MSALFINYLLYMPGARRIVDTFELLVLNLIEKIVVLKFDKINQDGGNCKLPTDNRVSSGVASPTI